MAEVVQVGALPARRRRRTSTSYAPARTAPTLPLLITLTSPDGLRLDVTERAIEGVGTISEIVEVELLELAHGDVDLVLRDDDEYVSRFLEDALPGEEWQVVIERKEGRSRRAPWRRVFGGLIELPDGWQRDAGDRTVSLQVFSYSKLLEQTSAEGVRKVFAFDYTASASAGSSNATVSPGTSGIRKGDRVQLSDETDTVVRTVIDIASGSVLVVDSNWGHTFAAGSPLIVETPYHRNKTIEYLAGELFAAAGITDLSIDALHGLGAVPFPTPVNDNLPLGDPRSIVDRQDLITVTFEVADSSSRFGATSPSSGFSTVNLGNLTYGDWRPYLDTEPGTVRLHSKAEIRDIHSNNSIGLSSPAQRTGNWCAFDHAGAHDFHLENTTDTAIKLYRDNVYQADLGFVTGSLPIDDVAMEYDPVNDKVWASYDINTGSKVGLYQYDPDGTSEVDTGLGTGRLRFVQQWGLMAVTRTYEDAADAEIIDFVDPSSFAVVKTLDTELSGGVGNIDLWTLRIVGEYLMFLYTKPAPAETWLRIYDATTLDLLSDTKLADARSQPRYLTAFSQAGKDDVAIIYAVGSYFVVSKEFAGVVPYADFSGLDVGGALAQLALISGTVVTVDNQRTGIMRPRFRRDENVHEPVLPAPLDQETSPLWTLYHASCEVQGETESGDRILEIAGDSGNSAQRLSLESSLVTTSGLAFAIASMYVALLSRVDVDEHEATFPDQGEIYHALSQVVLNERSYLVLEAEIDLDQGEHDLRLVRSL